MAAPHFVNSTHHCAIFQGNEQGATHKSFKKCKLHPGHEGFMTVDDFKEKAPSVFGMEAWTMFVVGNQIDRTVRVVTCHTSIGRPDTFINSKKPYPCIELRGSYNWIRNGTGFLVQRHELDVKELCHCPDCKTSTSQTPNRKSYYFIIKTSSHVIFDKQEAQHAAFEFFYDSEDRSNVKKIYGVGVLESDYTRLQTDRCFVVCVTHDDTLARQLGNLLRGQQNISVVPEYVLVSHPHGVSKRISVGDQPKIKNTFLFIPDEISVKLMTGMKIRFRDCDDPADVVQDINRLLDKRVIVFDDVSKTFVLRHDLTAHRPEGLVVLVERDIDLFNEKEQDIGWNISTPGTQLVANNGKSYTFPYQDHPVSTIKMEVIGKIKNFADYVSRDRSNVLAYRRYNMVSCPGSSGADVKYFGFFDEFTKPGHCHFGISGKYNTSSLYFVPLYVTMNDILKHIC